MQIQSINQQKEVKTPTTKVEPKRNVQITEQQAANAEALKNAQSKEVRDLHQTLAKHQISLSFVLDNQSNQVIVRLIDEQTGESIRQTPTEVSLKLAAVNASIAGQFINKNF